MKNFVQKGDVITALAPYALTSGQMALIGQLLGVAVKDAANGAEVELQTVGVFEITALGTDVGAVGALIYWDNTNRRLTVTATSNELVGCLLRAKANGETTALVRLNGTVA
jgi:predicted RecA/RadA family phage recombinase